MSNPSRYPSTQPGLNTQDAQPPLTCVSSITHNKQAKQPSSKEPFPNPNSESISNSYHAFQPIQSQLSTHLSQLFISNSQLISEPAINNNPDFASNLRPSFSHPSTHVPNPVLETCPTFAFTPSIATTKPKMGLSNHITCITSSCQQSSSRCVGTHFSASDSSPSHPKKRQGLKFSTIHHLLFLGLLTCSSCPAVALAFVLDNYINQQIHHKHHHNQVAGGKKQYIAQPVSSSPIPSSRSPTGSPKSSLYHQRKSIPSFQPNPRHSHFSPTTSASSSSNPLIPYTILLVLFLAVYFWFRKKRANRFKSKPTQQTSKSSYISYKNKKSKKNLSRSKASSTQKQLSSSNNNNNNSLSGSENANNETSGQLSVFPAFLNDFVAAFFSNPLFDKTFTYAKLYYTMASDTVSGVTDLVTSSAQQAFESASNSTLFSKSASTIEDEELIDLNAESFEEDDEDLESSDESESELSAQKSATSVNGQDLANASGSEANNNSTVQTENDNNSPASLVPSPPSASPTSTNAAAVSNPEIDHVAEEKKLKKHRKQVYEKQLKASKIGGLYNEGNTCFMNSIVQSLGSLDSIDVLLDQIVNDASDNASADEEYIPTASIALRQLIHEINIKRAYKHTYSASGLVRSMGKNSSRWLSSDQEDAQEYFQQVLDFLEKDTKAVLHPTPASSSSSDNEEKTEEAKEESKKPKIITPFDGQTVVRVGCLACGETEGLRSEMVSSVNLSLESTTSDTNLHALLREYTVLEVIPDVECYRCSLKNVEQQLLKLINNQKDSSGEPLNEKSQKTINLFMPRLEKVQEALKNKVIDEKAYEAFKVSSQKQLGDKSKQVMFAKPTAKVLPIHINRSVFDFRTGYVRKNSVNVAFPASLDLSPYVIADVNDSKNLNPENPMIPIADPNHELDVSEYDAEEEEKDDENDQDAGNEEETESTEQSPEVQNSLQANGIANGISNGTISHLANGTTKKSSSSKPSTSASPSPDSLIYNLKSVVVHYGSHNFGHYICYRKCRHNLWWKISDHTVHQVDLDQVLLAQGAFMLFYEQEYEGKNRKERLRQQKLKEEQLVQKRQEKRELEGEDLKQDGQEENDDDYEKKDELNQEHDDDEDEEHEEEEEEEGNDYDDSNADDKENESAVGITTTLEHVHLTKRKSGNTKSTL